MTIFGYENNSFDQLDVIENLINMVISKAKSGLLTDSETTILKEAQLALAFMYGYVARDCFKNSEVDKV